MCLFVSLADLDKVHAVVRSDVRCAEPRPLPVAKLDPVWHATVVVFLDNAVLPVVFGIR